MKKNSQKTAKPNPIPGNKPFKKGQSGNPSGRPKGSRNRSTIVREILSVIMLGENLITGKKEKLTIEEQMIFSMISQVIHKGNVHAWNSIKDDAYGKNKESVEMSGDILNILTPPTMSFEEWEKKTQTITKQI